MNSGKKCNLRKIKIYIMSKGRDEGVNLINVLAALRLRTSKHSHNYTYPLMQLSGHITA